MKLIKLIPFHYLILTFSLTLLLSISGLGIRLQKAPDSWPRVLSYFTDVPDGFVKVLDTIDGDTLTVLVNGKEESVRLLGVDTPETKDPRRGAQCFGREAAKYTKLALMGRAVRLESDPVETDRDKYNRLLRYVYLEDGLLFNELLVQEGYAFAYERYPTTRMERLKKLEEYAKANHKGLWSNCETTVKDNGKSKSTQTVE